MIFGLTKSDVSCQPIVPEECESCERIATHRIMVEVRAMGVSFYDGDYCEDCAAARVEGVRESLPDDEPEDLRELES